MNRLLLAIALVLAAYLVWRWQVPLVAPKIPHQKAISDYSQTNAAIEKLFEETAEPESFERFSSIVERPLFFKERRPPKPYQPEPPAKKTTKKPRKTRAPRIQLSAVVTIGKQTFALIKGGRERNTRRVQVGNEIEGWKVSEISRDRLVLKIDGEQYEVPLRQYAPIVPPKRMPKKAVPTKSGQGKRSTDIRNNDKTKKKRHKSSTVPNSNP